VIIKEFQCVPKKCSELIVWFSLKIKKWF